MERFYPHFFECGHEVTSGGHIMPLSNDPKLTRSVTEQVFRVSRGPREPMQHESPLQAVKESFLRVLGKKFRFQYVGLEEMLTCITLPNRDIKFLENGELLSKLYPDAPDNAEHIHICTDLTNIDGVWNGHIGFKLNDSYRSLNQPRYSQDSQVY